MKGKHRVKVSGSRVKYDFELTRNITIVQGKSGSGKTTLYDMISSYARLKEKSGVQVFCDKNCIALRPDTDWKIILNRTSDSIVFIDEEADYVNTDEFASEIKRTDNYYVIFNRENLHNLPYSVEEIYEIHTSGKLHSLKKIYKQQSGCRYFLNGEGMKNRQFSVLLCEDSKSGYEFYNDCFKGTNIECLSAGSNSSVYSWLLNNKKKDILVVADGAAFGAEMNRVMAIQALFPNIQICLPESFEWLILKSGLIKEEHLDDIMTNPAEYIESSNYFSREQFFSDFLIRATEWTYYRYSKNYLSDFYMIKTNEEKIVALIGLKNKI